MISTSATAPLSPARERQLIAAARRGDERAREDLVASFMPSIAVVARRYRGCANVERAELMQEGVVGLLTALERFEPERGIPFWAYASWWVRQAMQQLVAQMTRPVVMSDRALRQLARVKDARRAHQQAHHETPSPGDLAASTGLPRDHVERLVAVELVAGSLERRERSDGGTGPGDRLADPVAEDAYDKVDGRLAWEALSALPGGLTERERTVVKSHFGVSCDARTLGEIGAGLGVSAERVRQIEARALEKVRAVAGAKRGTVPARPAAAGPTTTGV